jgi:two-component system response regulator NreC
LPRKQPSGAPSFAPEFEIVPKHELTPRQLDVLKLLCDGFTSKQIGENLGIAPKTVEFHRRLIAKKIDSSKLALMVRWAIRNKIIEP